MTNCVEHKKSIKCVVWDLDDTIWHGVLLEDSKLSLRDNIVATVKSLDSRGILQSIASKNPHTLALAKLREFGLDEYFLYPEINWNSKASSVKKIAASINIGRDAIAFIDDQQFEREEVKFSLPEVLCLDPENLNEILAMPEMTPRFITKDSSARRMMYLSDIQRKETEAEFVGPQEEFLKSLRMKFTIRRARPEDLVRAEELTVRTNQLNTTGYTYSYDELNEFMSSDQHKLLIASLTDKYGSYGKIGLALIDCRSGIWCLKLLLMSCRVISRGVGSIMMNHIMRFAKAANVRLRAEFVPNGRNRMMYVTYRFANFREVERRDEVVILETDLSEIQHWPDYVQLDISDAEEE